MGQVAVLYPCTIAAHILIALGRQRADLAALAAGAAVVVVGCVVLDGAFGSTGAAVGLLAGSLVAGAAMLVAIRRYLGTSLSIPGWRLLAAACVLIGVTAAVHVAVALEVAALVGIAAYLIAAFLFGCLTRADIVHMVEIVRSRRSRRSNAA
jgi:O-antigen/teichoic acid export membrane protein